MESEVFKRHKETLLSSLGTIVELIETIDASLADVDAYMDALQPKWESGRLRILFVTSAGERVPQFRSMYRTRSEGGWHSKRVAKGMATRSLKRSGPFEPSYGAVKVLCSAGESLLAERASLMIRLRSVSSALRESVKGSMQRIEKIDGQKIQPFRQVLEPDRQPDP